jgi:hypothetical protein
MDPDPLVRGTDPDSSIIKQKYFEKPLIRNTDDNAGARAAKHCCEEGCERRGPHGAAHPGRGRLHPRQL